MSAKYSDYRWASPSELKCPKRPPRFLTRDELVSLCRQIIDPDGVICLPVFPNGEVISDESAAAVRILTAMGCSSVRTQVVWIDCREDIANYFSAGIDVLTDAHPELLAELEALPCLCRPKPIKSSKVKTWWVVREAS
jgi:hypothetical protein